MFVMENVRSMMFYYHEGEFRLEQCTHWFEKSKVVDGTEVGVWRGVYNMRNELVVVKLTCKQYVSRTN